MVGWDADLRIRLGEHRQHGPARAPAGAVDAAYFTGYTLFTLGNGEFQPVGGWWQIATVVATFSGFAVVSLAVTYIIPVVQAATTRRRTASTIAMYGTTPSALGEAVDSAGLDEHQIARLMIELAETHAAFPALHYLHLADETQSAPAMIANLGLALGPVDAKGGTEPVQALRAAILRYLTLHPPIGSSTNQTWEAQLDRIRLDDGRGPPIRRSADRTDPLQDGHHRAGRSRRRVSPAISSWWCPHTVTETGGVGPGAADSSTLCFVIVASMWWCR